MKGLPLLLAAALAALLIWLLASGPGEERPEGERESGGPAAEEAASADSAAETDATVAPPTAFDDTASELRAALDPALDGGQPVRLTVRVVLGATMEPYVPDELFLIPAESDEEWEEVWQLYDEPWTRDLEEEPRGQRFAAEPGQDLFELRVPWTRAGILVRSGSHRGFLFWQRGEDRDPLLRVWPLLALEIQVFDAGGAPAEGAVVKLTTDEGGNSWGALTRRTDAEGRQLFDKLGTEYASLAARGGSAWFHPQVAGRVPSPVNAPLDPWPDRPVEIRLPPAGSLVVRAPGTEGFEGWVNIRRVFEKDAQSGAGTYASGSGKLEGASARIPWVALGHRFQVSVSPRDWFGPRRVEVAGPRRVGEVVEITVDLASGPCVTGILVDAEGAPHRSRLWSFSTDPGRGGGRVATDAEGRFRLLLEDQPRTWQVYSISPSDQDEQPDFDPSLSGSLDLRDGVPVGWHEVGEIRVGPAPVVFGGRVVDEAGEPVEGVRVGVHYPVEGRSGTTSWAYTRGLEVPPTGPEGRFQARGPLPPASSYRLNAWKDGWIAAEPVYAAKGAEELEILLRRGASFEAELELSEQVPAWDFQLRLLRRGADPPRGESCHFEEGVFRWEGVEPGHYDVHVQLDDEEEPVLVVEDVLLIGGETTRDPRLWPADLRDAVRVFRLVVVDLDGEPFADGAAFCPPVREGKSRGWGRDGFFRSEREGPSIYQLRCDARRDDGLAVSVPGRSPEFLLHPADGDVVRLGPAPVVSLRLSEPIGPTKDGRRPTLALYYFQSGSSDPRFTGLRSNCELLDELDGRDTIRLRYMLPAIYNVYWSVLQGAEGESSLSIASVRDGHLQLDLSQDGVVLPLEVPPEILEALD